MGRWNDFSIAPCENLSRCGSILAIFGTTGIFGNLRIRIGLEEPLRKMDVCLGDAANHARHQSRGPAPGMGYGVDQALAAAQRRQPRKCGRLRRLSAPAE